MRELSEYRRRLGEHRAALAMDSARPMVDALITAAPGWSDDELEDDLCVRFGAAMTRYVLPAPLSESARDLVAEHLDDDATQRVTRERAVTGPALWTRDGYGSRWVVVAPLASADGSGRWYLWDVHACGYELVTVHSGFYPSAEAALAEWQQAVGPSAAGATVTAADDTETLDALLTGEWEVIRSGGEDQAQYAEFLRSRRLGRTVRQAAGQARGRILTRLSGDTAR